MSFIAKDPEGYHGKVVGTGQCVAFVEKCAGCPPSSSWKKGADVKGSEIPIGTAIATFIDGEYLNLPHGNHAAIYIEQDEHGITVWDQWTGQPVHKRVIRFKGIDCQDRSNNGDCFSVIII
jgi:hypothetical protein